MPPVDYVKQAFIYLYSVLGGVLFAFLYDVLRISRRSVKHSHIVVIIQDIIYWLIISISILLLIYRINEGEIRGYIIIGIVCGAILYFLLFSKAILFITVPIMSVIVKILIKILNIFKIPLKAIEIVKNKVKKPSK